MNYKDIAIKWQKIWQDRSLFEAEVDLDKPKYMITAAFPYPNSPQHIGHARTYTIADSLARYKRMSGYNVLFPMAFHVTGTPIMAMAKRIEEKDEELLKIFTNIYGIEREYAESLTDPRELVMAFSKEIEAGMKEMGFSIDWRRKFYTFDQEFNSYVKWQFHKLKEYGVITKGKHQVPYCPKCKNVVGGHDTKGDVDPEMGEFIVIKFPYRDGYLVPATLRPETLYGVTNIWINPDADYLKVKVGDEIYYISQKGAKKLEFQDNKVEILERFTGRELIKSGHTARNPINNREIPIYPAIFVDSSNATGVVMSVPAHAPYDYVAFKEIGGKEDDIIKIIDVDEPRFKGKIPAKEIVLEVGISGLDDTKLKDATKTLYRHELHHGKMIIAPLKEKCVEKAREEVGNSLIKEKKAFKLYEILNRPVKCRCGGTIEVKILDDQWFIDYGNPKWKEKALNCLMDMRIIPEKRKKDLEYAINWLHEKACTRDHGLGTKFPFDESKMIEALSDSTIYMAFYTVRDKLKRPLSVEEWDYVILGRGKGNQELKELREAFNYWYPVDSRHSGADLIYNHLPFFIYNHTAIFPREKWPKQIVVNGFVLMDGQKMSKSLGNILPLRKAIEEYGPDPIRISVVGGAELGEDTDFNKKLVEGITARLNFIRDLSNRYNKEAENRIEKWLENRFKQYARETIKNYETLNLREIVHKLIYLLVNDVKWTMKRGGKPSKNMLKEWMKLIAPIAPHFADEMWEKLGMNELATTAIIDKNDYEGHEDLKLNEGEKILRRTIEDIKEIKELIKIEPKRAYLIIASPIKRKLFRKVSGVMNYKEAIKIAMDDEEIKKEGKKVLQWIKSSQRWGSKTVLEQEEEMRLYEESKDFISSETGVKEIKVISEEKAINSEGLKDKGLKALPGKPSIVFE